MTTNNEAFEKWYGKWCSYYGHYDVNKTAEVAWEMATTEASKRMVALESELTDARNAYHESRTEVHELQASNNRLREALGKLIYTKEYKDMQGKDEIYENMRRTAWKTAEQALSATPAESPQAHDDELLERAAKEFDKHEDEAWIARKIRALKTEVTK